MVLSPPVVDNKIKTELPPVVKYDSSLLVCKDSWLHTAKGGIYELYVTGDPYEMGLKNGLLTKELAFKQEIHFVDFIRSVVPSETTLNYLRYFITLFNKDLDEYILLDYRKEIYGISEFAADEFDFIGEKYHRILNYHAAHDIGHTLQNMNLVNCTAFGVQNEYTTDSSLYIGRNLDFSAGDAFAKNKIVVFCKPSKGYAFAYVSWGAMIGVLSGMNEYGLTITLNSAKSGIPLSAKAPVSLVARDVLQNAKTINEAFYIIKGYETFVSESFLVGTDIDNKVVVIEKSLETTALYESNESKLVLTNHFQSEELKDTELNKQAIDEGCSKYRMELTHELIDNNDSINHLKMVDILRNKNGKGGDDIGIGNEMAINQLICHHSVVFNPSKRLMWVSAFPYQENFFLAYDLNVVFSDTFDVRKNSIIIDSLEIPASDFYKTGKLDKIRDYRSQLDTLRKYINLNISLPNDFIESMLQINPNDFTGYYLAGLYYKSRNKKTKALSFFKKALDCEFPRKVDKQVVLDAINNLGEFK